MEIPVQIIYIDEALLAIGANFVFDWLLLWSTAEVTKTPTTRTRLLAGATLGTFHFVLYLLATYGAIGYYGVLRFPGTVALVSLGMLAIAFLPDRTPQRMLRLMGTFYVILFISSGAGLAAGNMLAYGGKPLTLVSIFVAIGTLVIVAEVGWGVIQKRIWRGIHHVPIEVHFGERHIQVMALLDTGNQLTDPLTMAPVVVIELEAVLPIFEEGLQLEVAQLAQGDFSRVSSLLAHSTWSSRFRLIPFSSLGQENGMLIGFKPDRIRIMSPQSIDVSKRVIIGLARHTLDRDGHYRALLHPSLLDSAADALEVNRQSVRSEPRTAAIQSDKGGTTVVDTSS